MRFRLWRYLLSDTGLAFARMSADNDASPAVTAQPAAFPDRPLFPVPSLLSPLPSLRPKSRLLPRRGLCFDVFWNAAPVSDSPA
jgi:hypothetical protein